MPRRPMPNRRANPAARMMMLRQWHTYIGAFIAPSVIFFALTGALQLFHLHEAHDGYTPPALIEKLGAVHKDQEFRAKPHRGPGHRGRPAPAPGGDADASGADEKAGGGDRAPAARPAAADAAQIRTWALKWVFLVVALGLVVSTVLGLWMAFTTGKRKAVILVVVIVGAALPVLLLAL